MNSSNKARGKTRAFLFARILYWGVVIRKYILGAGLALLLAAFGIAFSQDFISHYAYVVEKTAAVADGTLATPFEHHDVSPSYFSLIVEPDSGIEPILSRINTAEKSIELVMYLFEDERMVKALGDAHARGVQVRVLLNGGYYSKHEKRNEAAFAALEKLGVAVKYTPTYFALTHQKTLVFDSREALVMTFNFQSKYYKTGRDFAIANTNPRDVRAIQDTFAADWNGKQVMAQQGDTLLWSPGSEDELLYLINSATSSLKIYNELMGDEDIIDALIAAAARGVDVRVDMTYATNWKPALNKLTQAGVHVRTWASSSKILYIHTKMIVVDGTRAFVGSENFSENSLNKNRELGMVLDAPHIVAGLEEVFDRDWAQARPFVVMQ